MAIAQRPRLNPVIRHYDDAPALARAYPVMRELRTHLGESEFVERALRQMGSDGYRLAGLEQDGVLWSLAGYRYMETLFAGRSLYVDDLVTRSDGRGRGYGSALFDWLLAQARDSRCAGLHLDSGVQRFGAHRFYLHKGLDITSHHFAVKLA
jgi:GNAT superfamily N-acetyltransferase